MPSAPPGRLRARAGRTAVVLGGALVAVPLLAGVASAHVAVSSTDAVRGGESALVTFRVPNESATAGTVTVTVTLPTTALVGLVDTTPIAGWTVSTTTRTLAAPTKVAGFTLDHVTSSVTWTAYPGVSIGKDQFQLFSLLVGPLPDAPTMVFTATQTYSDGTVVRWDQPYPASGVEPDHPTPVLDLPADAAATAPAAAAPGTAGSAAVGPATDGTARVLGGAGLLVGVLGLGVGAAGMRRRGRRSSGAGR